MLRLTGGEFRGRLIESPAHENTRPTQAKLRQALFNSIQAVIPDANVLDLFAGSGSLGFEALSRGAAQVVFVESERSVCKLIEKNSAILKVQSRIEIVCDSVEHAWKRLSRFAPFDLVLADPPYSKGWEKKTAGAFPWDQLLKPDGILSFEWAPPKKPKEGEPAELEFPFLVKIREKNYGDSVLSTFKRESHESQ